MIERVTRHFGRLVFDRDAIVRGALRAYVETYLQRIARFWYPASDGMEWTGDLQRGAIYNDDGCGEYEVVAWNEAGVVGLAYALGCGPIDQLGLSLDAVTRGPDDVRGAVPGLPAELESAFVMAVGMLATGEARDDDVVYGEKLAGVGFWLHGDRVEGTLFDVRNGGPPHGARRLAAWGLLHKGRLLPLSCESYHPRPGQIVTYHDRPQDAPAHAVIDAVVDRRLKGPTEFTPAELETLLFPTPNPKRVLAVQRGLQKVGITWPGSPKIPEPPPKRPNPFLHPPTTIWLSVHGLGNLAFHREVIVRAALRAYVEAVLAQLDPLERHPFTATVVPRWTGDLKRGAFYNGSGCGSYDVVAWTEAGVVALAYEPGFGPIEQLGLSASAVKGGPDDVRAALPELPSELTPALEMAVGMLEVGAHGEKQAGVGFWLHGAERVAGTFFDDATAPGVRRLAQWGRIGTKLLRVDDPKDRPYMTQATWDKAEPIQDLVDAVFDRALAGPTELLPDELATLLPTPPDPKQLLAAQRRLQKVGITWPGSPEIPEDPT